MRFAHFSSSHGLAACVIVAAIASGGCAARQRIVDGTVVNGIPGTATGSPAQVQGLAPGELVLLYPGPSGLERPGEPARVEFVHYERSDEKAKSGGGGGGSSAGGLGADLNPHLVVQKTVALDDDSPRTTLEVDVDKERIRGRSDAAISYYFTIENKGGGPASAATIVDSLPDGYEISGVDVYDNGGHAVWKYIPPIAPAGWILLPVFTFPSSQSKTKFDSVVWDKRTVDGHTVILVQLKMGADQLKPGDFAVIRVAGHMPFPVAR
jgi:hypothetical protein